LEKDIEIKSIKLHNGQKRIKDHILKSDAKFHIINSSRQAGKTTLLTMLVIYYATSFSNLKILWVAPVFSTIKLTFNFIINKLIESGAIKNFSRGDQTIEFINGSVIYFKSSTMYDNIRGGSYDYAFIDEFCFIPPEAWQEAIRPTLNVRGKKAIIASTPKGKDLFYQLAKSGEDPDEPLYTYDYMNYIDNPYYNLNEVEDARKTLPNKVFLQEYEGQFLDDGGSVFENIKELATIKNWEDPKPGRRYFAGLDLGKQVDYTVLTIMDDIGNVVYIYREKLTSWSLMTEKIISILKRYNAYLTIEINAMGDPIYEMIKKQYSRVEPFSTTQSSKETLIESLIMAFNDMEIYIPTKELFPPLHNELELYTFDYNKKTRTIKYGAPVGHHDDTVMSLGFCLHSKKNFKTGQTKIRII